MNIWTGSSLALDVLWPLGWQTSRQLLILSQLLSPRNTMAKRISRATPQVTLYQPIALNWSTDRNWAKMTVAAVCVCVCVFSMHANQSAGQYDTTQLKFDILNSCVSWLGCGYWVYIRIASIMRVQGFTRSLESLYYGYRIYHCFLKLAYNYRSLIITDKCMCTACVYIQYLVQGSSQR